MLLLLFFLCFHPVPGLALPDSHVCRPCVRLLDGAFVQISERPTSCIKKGERIFNWPSSSNETECPSKIEIESNSIELDSGIVVSKVHTCLLSSKDWLVGYRWRCSEENGWRWSEFRIGYKDSKARRRPKRWFPRRRLPKHSPIHFQQDKYVVELAEDVPIRTVVVKVHANHASNEPLYYSMTAPDDSRSANLFSLDTMSGEILLAKPLDRETLAHHVLKLTAYERLDPQVSASATVIVDVLDVQDNSPQFERNVYFGEIKENASPGTTVLNVFARDLDAGLNGEITYSLKSQDDVSNLFTINPSSGVIQTRGKLDRETQGFVKMNAVATDKGQPPRNSTALIEITILDENDNSPQFTQPVYNITISENVTTPLILLQVQAMDADSGANGEVHYSIVTSTSSLANFFSIDYDTGELTLRQPLDLKHSPYFLVIRAKDSGRPALSSTAHCYVNVLDVNDHYPTFLHASPLHTISVEENVRIGFELGRLYAVDEDSGKNGEVRYRIEAESENVTSMFKIDEVTGVLSTIGEIDREKTDIYNMKVIAFDSGSPPLSTELQLLIKVIDKNDNSPRFEKEYYELQLSEDTPRGKQLLELRATDEDLDQKISYRIERMDRPLFALIELGADDGAVLSLAKPFSPLDEEVKLRISATDQGGLRGFTNLTLKIVDENSAPVFVETPISVKVSENAPIGSTVLHVKARDSDRGANSQLAFSIDSEDFGINNASGVIYVKKELDRERRASYSVTVSVTDDGDPPLSSSTILEIVIADVNDNVPKFLIDTYRTSIAEDAAVGTSFLQVQSVDPDEGLNGMVDYFLNDSDPFVRMDYFRLDRTSGLLQINKALDRETIPSFEFQVIARDRGQPPLDSHALIQVQILDANDNPPVFQQSKYDLWVSENSSPGTVVGTLVASDADEGKNQHIQFKIFGGPDAKLFEIEADERQNGVVRIKTRQEFDYEAKTNKFHVELQALSGQLSSTVPITIHISDQNDNQPQLSDFVVLIAQFEEERLNSFVGTIPAFDPDKNATLEYYLEPNEILEVDTTNGALRLKNIWRRQLDAESRVCVSDGPNTKCAKLQIVYVSVDEEALKYSVTAQLEGLTKEAFMDPNRFHRFLVSISQLNPSEWLPEDIRVFAIDEANDDEKPTLNISFFISRDEQVVSPWRIEQVGRLHLHGFDHSASVVRDELCANEPCAYYQQCKRSLKFDKFKEVVVYEADAFLFRSMPTIRSFTCDCPKGFTTNPLLPGTCNQRLNLCFAHSCLNNGTCIPTENSYRCECLPDRTGAHCELALNVDTCLPGFCYSNSQCRLDGRRQKCHNCPWHQTDTDERCRLKSVSFGGDSFLVVSSQLTRIEWTLEVQFSTISQNAIIIHASAYNTLQAFNSRSDFFEMSIKSGVPQIRASLGAQNQLIEVQMPDWKENRVADGEWHRLHVEFKNWAFRLWLDDCDPELSLRFNQHIGYKKCAIEAKIPLTQQCLNDLSLPCQRFLDLRPQLYLGGMPGNNQQSFVGCLRNLKVNSILIDFSNFDKMEKLGDVQPGCRRFRSDACSTDVNCPQGSKCVDRWEGHLCTCQHKLHSHKPCSLELPNGWSLFDEESYVQWRLPPKTRNQLLHFEFRTRERKTQVMAMEFDLKSYAFLFSLDSGRGTIQLGSEQYFFVHPDMANGEWHAVTVDFQKPLITLDHLYKKQLRQSSDVEIEPKAQSLYTGNVPSSAYPHQFTGCLRNVHFGGASLKVHDQSKTKPGCPVPNPCALSNICPKNSQCQRDWDRHVCKCLPGFVGDQCLDACSLNGLCNNGTCLRSDKTSNGYICSCYSEFGGSNCEDQKFKEQCPPGWFGDFEKCQKCQCRMDRGFREQCGEKTGECKCETGMYLKVDRCVPCECGYGSASPNCNISSGQCECLGDSVGRRCDQCPKTPIGRTRLLDRQTLKCVDLKDRCPATVMDGIQWPTAARGAISRQSCSYNQMGVATRECSRQNQWLHVHSHNCTLPSLFEIKENAPQLALQLLNLTAANYHLIHGRNLELSINILTQILLSPSLVQKEHLRDSEYTTQILAIFDQLLDQSLDEMELYVLLTALYEYGGQLAHTHARLPYLRPFSFEGHTMEFSISRHNRHQTKRLTKRRSPHSSQQGSITLSTSIPNATIFQARVQRNCHLTPCRNYGSEVFMFQMRVNGSQNPIGQIQVVFGLKPDNNDAQWSYPECMRAVIIRDDPTVVRRTDYFDGAPDSTLEWSRQGAMLSSLNRTHAICQFNLDSDESGSLFTLQIQPNSGALVQFAFSNQLPYTAPLSAAFALFLCLLAMLGVVFRSNVHMRSVRFAFIMSFVLSSTALFLLQRMTMNSMFCSVRNALITYLLNSQSIWILILALNLYRLLCEEKPRQRIALYFFAGLIFPCLMSTLSFLFGAGCSLSIWRTNIWFIAGSAVFILLLGFYVMATSLLISMGGGKHEGPRIIKKAMRRSVLWLEILTLFCSLYAAVTLYNLGQFSPHPVFTEAISNILLVFTAIYIFIWANFLSKSGNSNNRQNEFWVNAEDPKQKAVNEPDYKKPLLTQKVNAQHQISNDWTPELMMDTTYIHHTLQRSLQPSQLASLARNITEEDHYRRYITPAIRRDSPSSSLRGSIGRSPKHTSYHRDQTIRMTNNPLNAAAEQSDLSETYYEYRGRQRTLPCSTFT